MRWILLSAVLLMACPTPPPPPPMDAGVEVDAGMSIGSVELCTRFSQAQCDLQLRCYPAYSRRSRAACIEQTQAGCLAETERLRMSLEGGRVTIDGDQLNACEQRLKTSACPPSFPPSYPLAGVAVPFADCTLQTGLLKGAVATGQTCDDPVECNAGTFCVKPAGVCRGTCVAYSKLDEPCGIGCGEGLRCNGTTCVPLATLDEACASSKECEPDLLCLGSCRPRRKIGERCSIDYDRLSPCEPGLACDVVPFVDGAEGTCIVPKSDFESCRYHWSCKAGLVCADIDWSMFPTYAPQQPGLCRPPDGAEFNCRHSRYATYIGDQCEPGLSCNQSVSKCRSLPELGQSCTPSKQDCAGFEVFCKPSGAGDVGVCASAPAVGERCAVKLDATKTVSIPCAEGFCETEVTFQCRPASKPTGALCQQNGECISGRCVPQPDQTLKCAPAC
ncbi:MAG: hypothetical protein QM817_13050 [Archangium sp.]